MVATPNLQERQQGMRSTTCVSLVASDWWFVMLMAPHHIRVFSEASEAARTTLQPDSRRMTGRGACASAVA